MSKAAPEVRPIGHPLAAIQAVQILKIKDVCALTGLSRASVYRLAAQGVFPRPLAIGPRASGWRLQAVQEFLDSRTSNVRLAA